MTADEREYRLIPDDGVLGLEDPMVFIGKDQELRFHVVIAKCLKQVESFAQGATVVAFAMNDQRWRLPILNVLDRSIAIERGLIRIRVFTAHLQVPPGWVICDSCELGHREDACVGDQAPEAIGLRTNPVRHISAE